MISHTVTPEHPPDKTTPTGKTAAYDCTMEKLSQQQDFPPRTSLSPPRLTSTPTCPITPHHFTGYGYSSPALSVGEFAGTAEGAAGVAGLAEETEAAEAAVGTARAGVVEVAEGLGGSKIAVEGLSGTAASRREASGVAAEMSATEMGKRMRQSTPFCNDYSSPYVKRRLSSLAASLPHLTPPSLPRTTAPQQFSTSFPPLCQHSPSDWSRREGNTPFPVHGAEEEGWACEEAASPRLWAGGLDGGSRGGEGVVTGVGCGAGASGHHAVDDL